MVSRKVLNVFSEPDIWILMNTEMTFPESDFASISLSNSQQKIITISDEKTPLEGFTNVKYSPLKKKKIIKSMKERYGMKDIEI